MNQQSGSREPVVFEYLTLRKAVGIIGVGLPFALAFGKIISQGSGLQPSISGYYYTFLPETVPTHSNIHGQVDQYGSKWVALLMMPAAAPATESQRSSGPQRSMTV